MTTYYEVSPHHTLRGLTAYLDRLPAPKAQEPVAEFSFSEPDFAAPAPARVRAFRYFRMPALTQSVPQPTLVEGRADPVWDIQHTTKFSRKPAEDAPLVTPKGAAKVVCDFLDRAAEIAYLAGTQHLELATTRAEMAANGIPSVSLDAATSGDPLGEVIAEGNLAAAPYVFDPALDRRIEWERFVFACGPVERVRFEKTKDGSLGIVYDGPSKDPEYILARKRALKYSTIEKAGRLPTVEEVENAKGFLSYYSTPFFAYATQAQIDADYASRHGWTQEDPDPHRDAFHAVLDERMEDVGYAGPKGLLGLDDDGDDDSSADEEEDLPR